MNLFHGKWRTIAALLLVGSLLVVVGGCGPKPQEDASRPSTPTGPAPAPSTPAPTTPPPTGPPPSGAPAELRNPSDFEEMFWGFVELKYVVVMGGPIQVEYRFDAIETVKGSSCLRGTFDVDLSALGVDPYTLTVWIDDYTGRLRQAELDGEILDEVAGEIMVEGLTGMLFFPYHMLDEHRAGFVLSGEEEPDHYLLTPLSSKRERVAGHDATVSWYKITYPEEPSVVHEWAIADFGGFSMLVEWNLDDGDEFVMSMTVTHVVPRPLGQ